MKKGFLKLISSEIDLVHYIEIDDVYYTLTRDFVPKIEDYKNGNDFYIEFVDSLEQLEKDNPTDPYFLNRSPLTDYEKEVIRISNNCHLVDIELIYDQKEVMDFHNLSVKEDFYYFKDIENEPHNILLMKYKLK